MLTCSVESADSALPQLGLDFAPSPSPKSVPTPAACSNTGGPVFRTLAMCEPWSKDLACPTLATCASSAAAPTTANPETTAKSGAHDATPISETAPVSAPTNSPTPLARLTCLRLASLASLQACSANGVALLTSDGCGRIPSESSASFDHATASLRTRQLSLLSKADEPSTELLVNWPRSGMWDSTTFYPLPPLVQDISANVSSSLLPTPRAGKTTMESEESWAKRAAHGKVSTRPLGLAVKLKLLPTVTARDWKDTPGMARQKGDRSRLDQLPRRLFADLNATTGYKLNPRWCLWFMGYPTEWLNPLYDALATPSSRKRSSLSSMPSAAKNA